MDASQLKEKIAYCGLVCGFCNTVGTCDCKTGNHCGKRLAPGGCFQYTCCTSKNLAGCWECEEAPCGKDMHAEGKVKIRAFIRCIKEDSLDAFCDYLLRNKSSGIVYHRQGIWGDYDLDGEEKVLELLRNGKISG